MTLPIIHNTPLDTATAGSTVKLEPALIYNDFVTPDLVREVTKHYILCAVWADGTDGDEGISEFGDNAIAVSTADVHKFLLQAEPFLPDLLTTQTISQIGHDFWLTRNGHGAGFWDRDLGALGDTLSKIAESFGEVYLLLEKDDEYAEYELGC